MTLFAPPGGEVPAVRVRMTLAYDGSGFHGFAAQPGQRTVAGVLAESVEKVVGHAVRITCAGRTDTGVHAWGQVVHFDVAKDSLTSRRRRRREACSAAVDALAASCNRMLGPAIVVRAASLADAGFDARRSALSRLYRYTVLNARVADPSLARTAWHVSAPLELRSMRCAADPLVGEHDFSAFCRRRTGESLVRRVNRASWTVQEGPGDEQGHPQRLVLLDIEATSFCHQMVRSVVGTMVAVGLGRKRAGDISGLLRDGDRSAAGSPAPAHGLCLWAVRYPPYLPPAAGSRIL